MEVLCLLSKTPARFADIAHDLEITEKNVRAYIDAIRLVGYEVIVKDRTVRISDSYWPSAKQAAAEYWDMMYS